MESSALAEDGIYQERHIMDSLRVHGKNDRINSDERLIELLSEFSIISWDLVCFSETRLQARDDIIDGNHRLISSNDQNARSPATGIALLLHRRWAGQVKKKICLHDRVMAIDFKLSHRMVRVLAVYLPNAWNYDLNYFHEIFNDIERLSMEAMDKGYALNIAGDFNLSLQRLDRGGIMAEFY